MNATYVEIAAGIALLLLTLWQVRQGETDTIMIFDWWFWLDFDRETNPIIFWCIVGAQAALGIGLVLHGLIKA